MPPRRKRPAAGSVGLGTAEVFPREQPAEVRALATAVEHDGGASMAAYRDPLAGAWTLFVVLPIEKVHATPFQRELSKTHVDRLMAVIPKVGRYLDPIVATREDDGYWTPNGMHRLEAMRSLGAKSIVALLVPDREVAFRILALNTEKAHNLKDKALEVIRMARSLATASGGARNRESDWAFEFEEPAYLTVGLCYEQRPRFSGGAYLPILKRCEQFEEVPLSRSIKEREKRAARVLELDDRVNEIVAALKERGLKSAYLKPFVVARINPLRFVRAAKPGQKAPRAEFDETMTKVFALAKKFDPEKVRPQDVAAMGGAPPSEE
jgi:ParB family chromosome partitioning protein